MIIMPVPKDVRDFKPKFIGPLTKPQFVSLAVAGVVAVLLYGTIGKIMNRDVFTIILGIICIPIVACGFITVRSMTLPIYVRDVMIRNMLAPSLRPYSTLNASEEAGLNEQKLITYEYFDPDFGYTTNKKGERVKVKNRKKAAAAHLEAYLNEHPEMVGME